ncbi:heme ABC transporter ATP-binding protein [Ferrimonas sp.]|uniref:heme ABC transporter ATP-binding protein n=1 Tax=Ferrimonas sp. TaxID=2080861 RepID=UPI003A928DE7
MSFLTIQSLSLGIGGQPLLKQIELAIQPGRVTALLGPNGAGKSTLLKGICGDMTPDTGMVSFHGRPMEEWPRIKLARHLGVLPQHNSLTFPFTVRDVVEMGLFPLTADRTLAKHLVDHAQEQVDVAHLGGRRYPTLSGGEKQRVQLARVLTQLSQAEQAPLLLLDEPTSALDLAQQHRVLELARALAHEQGVGVIAVLHDLNQAARYADHLVVLDQGEVRYQGPPQEVLTGERVARVWHYRPTIVTDPKLGTPVVL